MTLRSGPQRRHQQPPVCGGGERGWATRRSVGRRVDRERSTCSRGNPARVTAALTPRSWTSTGAKRHGAWNKPDAAASRPAGSIPLDAQGGRSRRGRTPGGGPGRGAGALRLHRTVEDLSCRRCDSFARVCVTHARAVSRPLHRTTGPGPGHASAAGQLRRLTSEKGLTSKVRSKGTTAQKSPNRIHFKLHGMRVKSTL